MGVLPLKRHLKISDMENIFWTIQTAIRESKEDPIKHLKQYVNLDNITIDKDIYSCMVKLF